MNLLRKSDYTADDSVIGANDATQNGDGEVYNKSLDDIEEIINRRVGTA